MISDLPAVPGVVWRVGPQPGLIGDVAALHGRYHAREWAFPPMFEVKVARELGAMLARFDAQRDLVIGGERDGRFIASITLDASDPELRAGEGHLRWFIVDTGLQGHGVGRGLLDATLGFARKSGLTSVYLTTFRGLDQAAALYCRAGFVVTDEKPGETWGRVVIEQRLELRF